jgi:hypothetical protein
LLLGGVSAHTFLTKVYTHFVSSRDRAGGNEEIPGRPVGLWLFDARASGPQFALDQKSWQETLLLCMELQKASHVDPEGDCTERTPSSHCYPPPLKKDGTAAYDSFLLATNMVAICGSPSEQVHFKAAVARACSSKTTQLVAWDHTVVEGVYMFMDNYDSVSCLR